MTVVSEQQLRQFYPEIQWDEPAKIVNAETGEERWACRYCIAQYGLHGGYQENLPATPEQIREHIQQFHDGF